MSQENISPIGGLTLNEFEAVRNQIIEYIKMYSTDGEPIGAYKIMKLFEPFLDKEQPNSMQFSDWVASNHADENAGEGYEGLSDLSKNVIDHSVEKFIKWRMGCIKRSAEIHRDRRK